MRRRQAYGGALGRDRCYSDFLIFDGAPQPRGDYEIALRTQRVPAGTMIEFFVREKQGHRIAL